MKHALTAFLLTWGLSPATAETFSPEAPCPGCNVVLVSFDSLAAEHVSSLGYKHQTTPTIDALAKRGALFSQAVSPAPWTVPAHMSWFTGTYPSLHKVVNKYVIRPGGLVLSNLQELSPGMRTLPEVLKEHGYATGGFTGGAGVSGVFGFKSGFDVYSDDVPPFTGMEVPIPKALDWLKGLGSKRFFLFLHGYGIHGQYMPPGGYDKRYVDPPYKGPYDGTPSQQRVLRELGLRGPIELDEDDARFWQELYDEKISRTDAQFAGFLSALKELRLDERTVFILASDHGEEDYEHRKFDHGHTLYDELQRVLLVVVSPGIKGNQVIRAQVGTLNMLPTILGLVGIPLNPKLQAQIKGKSLVPLLQGRETEGDDVYMETDYRLYTRKRGLRTRDGWKLIDTLDTGKVELYNLKDDPRELKDLAASDPSKVKELKARLSAHDKTLGVDPRHWEAGCSPVYADQCH